MRRTTRDRGEDGEREACGYLRSQGFRILVRNYRYHRAEIDIVAEDHGELVFVEVKARESLLFGEPEESVTPSKEERLRRAAEGYCIEQGMVDRFYRFDIVSILITDGHTHLKHIRNAF